VTWPVHPASTNSGSNATPRVPVDALAVVLLVVVLGEEQLAPAEVAVVGIDVGRAALRGIQFTASSFTDSACLRRVRYRPAT